MSFSIGSASPGMGPRSAMETFGSTSEKGGDVFNKKVVSRMLTYLRPYTGRMVLALILTLIQSGLTLLSPYLVSLAIDDYITPGDINGLTGIAVMIAATFVGTFIVS